jgi:hypothetical protein
MDFRSTANSAAEGPCGKALLVGLTRVDPEKYPRTEEGLPWDGKSGCWGCKRDLQKMLRLLEKEGYSVETLLDEQACINAVRSRLEQAARAAKPGDTFFFYFTGHGGGVPDQRNGDEGDGIDETICLFDGQFRDDNLNEAWVTFPEGSVIFMLSDSCHSGTSYRNRRNAMGFLGSGGLILDLKGDPRMKASLLHIGACRDSEQAVGDESGSLFTSLVVSTWDEGRFQGDWNDFHDQISASFHPRHAPQGNLYGPEGFRLATRRPFQSLAKTNQHIA